jgi:hypothetical protein
MADWWRKCGICNNMRMYRFFSYETLYGKIYIKPWLVRLSPKSEYMPVYAGLYTKYIKAILKICLQGMKKKNKKGVSKVDDKSQTFSMDILIALGIFIAGIVVFLYLIGGNSGKDVGNKLVAESEVLPQRLIAADEISKTNSTIIIGNRVDSALLNKSIAKDYTAMKNDLDVVSDFCIHFEDDNGNIVDLDEDSCWVQYSMGDSRLTLSITDAMGVESAVPCGTRTYVC